MIRRNNLPSKGKKPHIFSTVSKMILTGKPKTSISYWTILTTPLHISHCTVSSWSIDPEPLPVGNDDQKGSIQFWFTHNQKKTIFFLYNHVYDMTPTFPILDRPYRWISTSHWWKNVWCSGWKWNFVSVNGALTDFMSKPKGFNNICTS